MLILNNVHGHTIYDVIDPKNHIHYILVSNLKWIPDDDDDDERRTKKRERKNNKQRLIKARSDD